MACPLIRSLKVLDVVTVEFHGYAKVNIKD